MAFSWSNLEAACAAEAARVARRVFRKNPRHTFYAAALQSYRELDRTICLPCLALNSVEALQKQQGAAAPYDMASANWRWFLPLVKTPKLKRLQKALDSEANRSTQGHWYRTETRFLSTMVRVAKRIYRDLKNHKQTTRDFCVYFDDEEDPRGLPRRCMSKSLYMKHFHDGESAEGTEATTPVSKLTLPEKLERYLADLFDHEDEIAALGEVAIDSLIAKLGDEEDGWNAALLLGRIGVANSSVIRALRQQVRNISGAAHWSASALAMLGDTKYLFKLAEDDALAEIAIRGLAFPYEEFGDPDDWPRRPKLDYGVFERLLDRKSPAWTRIVTDALSPGRGFVSIRSDEIDEALRALQSPHVLIRQHAVCILDNRALGPAAGKRILPALVECLEDSHANVRRLAILSISSWKAAAKPYLPAIKLLFQDKNANVRETARWELK
jgi:hypothetical protein